jgi:hypothetical protein
MGVLARLLARFRRAKAAAAVEFRLTVALVDAATGTPINGLVRIDGQAPQLGYCVRTITFLVPVLGFTGLNVNASHVEGYAGAWAPVAEPVDQTVTVRLAAIPKPVVTSAGERGALHIETESGRPVMVRADGSIFPWVGCSDFALFARFARGEDIAPILDERIACGFNLLRVFGMFDGFGIGGPQASGLGMFTPASTPGYYTKLRAFVDLTQSRGLRIEYVYFADADARSDGTGGLMTGRAERQAHIDAVRAALLGTWGVCHEIANEAFKNFADAESYTLDPALGLRAYGTKLPDGDIPAVWPVLDYLTVHDHERKEEWPRTVRGYGEIVDVLRVPVVADEPMGFAEVARPGSRATSADDAAWFAAGMAMFASGSTFHSDDGVASRLFRPVQRAAAQAWASSARWVPAEAQLAPYQRGGDCGTGGIGQMPIEHCDLETGASSRALRSFAKTIGAVSWALRMRPVGPTLPRDGWRLTEEPRLGFAKLAR